MEELRTRNCDHILLQMIAFLILRRLSRPHHSMLIRNKNREFKNDICSSSNPKTHWECSHEGNAIVDFERATGNNERNDQKARIQFAAGQSFLVQVRHDFSTQEVHQPPPTPDSADMRSMLTVKVNGRKKKTFRSPRNIGIPSHIVEEVFAFDDNSDGLVDLSGYINPEYRGTYFVMINCDDDCECSIQKQAPETKCEVTAKLVPSLQTYPRGRSER